MGYGRCVVGEGGTRRAVGRPVDPELAVRRRAELVAAANDVFAELGYHSAGINDITRRAGVARGTFYTYFDSKRAILDAVIDGLAEDLLSAVGELLVLEPTADLDEIERRLRSCAHLLFAVQDRNPGLLRLMLRDGAVDEEITARVLGMFGALQAAIVALIESGMRARALESDVDPTHAAIAVIGVGVGLLLEHARQPLSPAQRDAFLDTGVSLLRRIFDAQ